MDIVVEASASRRWLTVGLVLLLAALNAVAWTGWRPAKDLPSYEDLEQLRADLLGSAFELIEEDYERIESGLVPVLVVDMLSEQTVAGASVWLSEQGWTKRFSRILGGSDRLAEYPPKDAARTDQRGIAWIPLPVEHCLVLANSDGFGAWSFFIPGDPLDALARCCQIKLVCSIPSGAGLRVERPADASGLPLPVFVRSPNSFGRMPLRAVPGGSGEVIRWMDLVNLDWVDEESDPPLLLVPGFCDEAALPLTHRTLRRGRVQLPAPPTGQILVQLSDLNGFRLEAPSAVFLEAEGKPWVNAPSIGTEGQIAGIAESGALLLRGVPLSKRWNVGYRLPGVLGRISTTMQGPVKAGETVQAVTDPLWSCLFLRPTLHYADGALLKEREVWARLAGKDGERDIRDSGTFLTDAEGIVEIACAKPLSGEWLTVQFFFDGDGKHPACRTKELSIPESGNLGEPEAWLGDAHRAWGIVEDSEGDPVAGASVGTIGMQSTHVAPDGSFQFSEADLESHVPFELVAASPWHLPARARCEAPDLKVRFHLRQGSRVHGRLLLPSSSRRYRVVVEARGAMSLDPDLEAARAEYDVFTREGRFDCGPVPAGTWDLRLRVGGLVVAEAPGAVLMPGEVLRDPRLAAIDLRDHVQMYVGVALQEGRGEPERAYVMVEMPGGLRLMAQKGALLLPPGALRVGVVAPGFKEKWHPVQAGDVKFLLEKE